MPAMNAEIAVLARAPRLGRVKTRLAPLLGDAGALMLHRQLVESTLFRARDAALGAVTLWVADGDDDPEVQTCAARQRVALRAQQGADLGERMHAALAHSLQRSTAALLIGTDCPALQPRHLQQAAQALAAHEIVLIPAHDGGYVLIGLAQLAQPPAALFDGIAWGSPSVLAATRERIAQLGLRAAELHPLPDLDTPDDYRAALAAGWIAA